MKRSVVIQEIIIISFKPDGTSFSALLKNLSLFLGFFLSEILQEFSSLILFFLFFASFLLLLFFWKKRNRRRKRVWWRKVKMKNIQQMIICVECLPHSLVFDHITWHSTKTRWMRFCMCVCVYLINVFFSLKVLNPFPWFLRQCTRWSQPMRKSNYHHPCNDKIIALLINKFLILST